MQDRYVRQSGLIDPAIYSTKINIVGAGGIGSFTTLSLAKMGFNNIIVYDFDTIEEHNLPNQFYREEDLGQPKVIALNKIVKAFTGTEITTVNDKFNASIDMSPHGVFIPAVDNMETREYVYKSYSRKDNVLGMVDGRMGGQQAEVYTIDFKNNEDKKQYKSRLWKDSETSPLPCTERAVLYNVLWIASTIANNVRLLLSQLPYKRMQIMDFQNGNLLTM